MSRRRLANLFLIGGVSLVLLASYLLVSSLREDQRAGEASALALTKVQAAVMDGLAEAADAEIDEAGTPARPGAVIPEMTQAMAARNIDGYDYIGWLELPSVDITLPIMADWDEESLKQAPTRHRGTTYADDLVIAGHNYWNHFRDLEFVEAGDRVLFTDMDGIEHHYIVGEVRILAETEVAAVLNSPWDLAIYSCKFRRGIRDRMVVFADRATD